MSCESARVPLPHAEHGFGWQGVSHLTSEHGDLAAVVGIVRDEVPKESSHIGAKTLDAAIAFEGATDHGAQGVAALFQGTEGLPGSDLGAIELSGELPVLGRRLQPHNADIVHVRDNGGNGAALAVHG